MRDLGLPQDDGGSRIGGPRDDGAVPVDVDATALPYDDPDRAAWAVAHWAVATAATTGAVEVRVADQVWTRDSAAWTTLPADRDPRPAGQVRVLVGPDPS